MFPGACFQFALLWGSWLWPVLHSCVEYMCSYLKCVGFHLCSVPFWVSLSFRDLHMIGRCMFYGKAGPLGGCESSFRSFRASRDARRTNWRGKQVGGGGGGFSLTQVKKCNFSVQTWHFLHIADRWRLSARKYLSLGSLQQEYPWKAFTLPRFRASWGQYIWFIYDKRSVVAAQLHGQRVGGGEASVSLVGVMNARTEGRS